MAHPERADPVRTRTDPATIRRCLDIAEQHGTYRAEQETGVHHKTLYRWIAMRAERGPEWPTPDDIAAWHADHAANGARRARRAQTQAARRKHTYLGHGPALVPAVGTQRRIQALYALGWTCVDMGAEIGATKEAVARVMRGSFERLTPRTVRRIGLLYARLSMVVPVDKPAGRGTVPVHERARRDARRRGYAPPLAWDDIDNSKEVPAMGQIVCAVNDCDGLVKARGFCNKHYLRDVRHGSPLAGGKARILNDEERLWSQIDKTEHCWVWTAATTDGYGYTRWEGESWRVHRLVYVLLVGPIEPGLQLDHLCRNRSCCNPAHLEPVTQQENIARGERSIRTTCPEGHPYDVVIERRGGKERRCSICEKARRRARTERDSQSRVNVGRPANEVIEDVAWLLEHDPLMTARQVSERLGFADSSSVQHALKRAGRADILAQLARNAVAA